MKALVIDDDPTAQKIMKLLLEQAGYDPVLFSSGREGLAAALGPGAPPLVILDWIIPDLDGPAVCKQLRAANLQVRPYIIFLTAKREKSDAALALDTGADDFLSKPFNLTELQARLRVARRTLDYQRELQTRADAQEGLGQRSQLLDEISSKQPELPGGAVRPVAAEPVLEPAPMKQVKVTDFSNQEVRFLLSATLLEMRLVLEAAKLRNGAAPLNLRTTDYCGWGAVLLPEEHGWLDLIVAVKPKALTALFEKTLGRQATREAEHRHFLAELTQAIVLGFTRMLERRVEKVLNPSISRTVKLAERGELPDLPPTGKSYDMVIAGEDVQLILTQQACPVLRRVPIALRELDVLAEPFPPKEVSEIPMFMEGTVLTPRFIEKLVYHQETTQTDEPIKIRRPSSVALYFSNAI